MTSRIVLIAAFIASTLALAGCANTVRGVGRDVNNTGQATAKAVRGY